MWRQFRSLMLAAMVLAIVGTGEPARAQRRDLLAEPEEEQPAQPQPRPAVAMTDEQFEQWLFGRVGGAGRVRTRLESRLAWEINRVDQLYDLNPEQKKKLEVAGRGDIKRLFDRLREKKEMLDRVKLDRLQARAILVELQSIRMGFEANFFGNESFFIKTLRKTLNPEQRARYDKGVRDFYRSRVEWAVFSLDRGIGLSDEQRRRFIALIVEQTRPLKKYDGNYDFYAIFFQASKLPEAKVKPIFDDGQWRRLRLLFEEAQKFEGALVANGHLHANEAEAAVRSPRRRRTKQTGRRGTLRLMARRLAEPDNRIRTDSS